MSDQPGYTRVPNDILDAMPTLGNAELRVLLAIARKTVGWQKECDRLSARQLSDTTGLTLKNTQQAITGLLKKGLVAREKAGKQTFCYNLQTVPLGDTDQNRTPSDTVPLRDTVPYPVGIRLDEKPYPVGIQQKKDSKERKEILHTPRKRAGVPVEKSDHQKIMDAYQESLGYAIRDGPKEGNAAKWLINNGYTPDQVQACYAHLKCQSFWREKHISLQTVAGQIGAYLQSKNGHTNGKHIRQGTRPNPERKPQVEADLTDGFG